MTIPLILLYLVPLEIHTHKTKLISFIQISQNLCWSEKPSVNKNKKVFNFPNNSSQEAKYLRFL